MLIISNKMINIKEDGKLLAEILLIVILFNAVILAFLLPNFATTSKNNVVSDTNLDPTVSEAVNTALSGFSDGFIAQAPNDDAAIQYYIKSSTMMVGFGQSEIKVLMLSNMKESISYTPITLTFPKANNVKPVASHPISSNVIYYIGSSTATTKQEYSKLTYKNLYTGIDLEYIIQDGALKYNFLVHPGADPSTIKMQWQGPVTITKPDTNMVLYIQTPTGLKTLVDNKPYTYQSNEAQSVQSSFVQLNENTYGFKIGKYVTNKLLVIDPLLMASSTYYGGAADNFGNAITLDSAGNIYIAGGTTSGFPITNNATFNTYAGDPYDGFVVKISNDGQRVYFSTYIGGSSNDIIQGIKIDSTGNIYVTGQTYSSNFPTQNAFNSTFGGNIDVFVVKLSSTGLVSFSSYLGGSNKDYSNALAIDSNDNMYITGFTWSSNFQTVNAFNSTFNGGSYDAFIAKISSTGSLLNSSYLGGSSDEIAEAMVISNGNVYITGTTTSTNFPTSVGAYNRTPDAYGSGDVFVVEFNSNLEIIASTFVGGSNQDLAHAITADASSNVYVAGTSISTNFPVTVGAYDNNLNNPGYLKPFWFKLSSDLSTLQASSFIGGTPSYSDDNAYGIALGPNNEVYIAGKTYATDFPLVNEFIQNKPPLAIPALGVNSGFLSVFSPDGTSLSFSTFIGGPGTTVNAIVSNGNDVYLTGATQVSDFPIINPIQSYLGGTSNLFLMKITNSSLSDLSVSQQTSFPSNSTQSIALTWQAPTYQAYVANYSIYRSTTPGSGYGVIGSTNNTNFIDSTAIPGVTYYYIISAICPWSSIPYINSTEFTGLLPTTPSAPSLSLTLGNFSILLDWTVPSSDGGSAIIEYQIYRGTSSGVYSLIASTTSLSFNDTTVTNQTTYYYAILALNGVGKSTYSTEQSLTAVGTTPLYTVTTAPTLSLTQGNFSILLDWTVPSSDGGSAIIEYQIYRGTSSGVYSLIASTTSLSFNDTTVTNQTTYYYAILALNSVGKSPYSTEQSLTASGTTPVYTPITHTSTVTVPSTTTTTTVSSIISQTTSTVTKSTPGFELLFLLLGLVGIFVLRKLRISK